MLKYAVVAYNLEDKVVFSSRVEITSFPVLGENFTFFKSFNDEDGTEFDYRNNDPFIRQGQPLDDISKIVLKELDVRDTPFHLTKFRSAERDSTTTLREWVLYGIKTRLNVWRSDIYNVVCNWSVSFIGFKYINHMTKDATTNNVVIIEED